MKKIIYFSVITATALSLLSSCVDTHDTLPYVDPNIQSSQPSSSDKSAYGTADSPIEISSIKDLGTNNDTAYVSGYIVGYVCGTKLSTGAVFLSSDTVSQTANLLIAESADVTESSKCVPVQLPTGKIRTALNLKDNKGNFGKQVVIGGCMAKYFGVKGLKNTFYAKIDGKEISSILAPVDNTSPQPVVSAIDEPFSESMGDFRFRDVISADSAFDVWSFTNYGMVASAFKNKKNFATESWLVSPPVDLTGKTTAYFTFDHAAAYFADNNLIDKACQVLASNDSTDWEALEITWPKESNGKSYTFVNSGVIDLSKYAGKSRVRVAFKYTSTAEKAGTWELKNVKLQETEPVIIKQEHAAKPEGDGTKEKPYNVAAIQENEVPSDYVWVKAVIVGFLPSSGKVTFSTTGAVATNLAIADADTVKTELNSTSVKLPAGDFRTLLNILDNPDNLKKEVLMYVKIGSYNGFSKGITEIKYVKIGDKEAGIDPTAAPKEKVTSKFESDDNTAKEHDLPYEEDFASSIGDFSFYTVSRAGELSDFWSYDSKYGLKVMSKESSTSNADNYEGDGYAISPAIKLTNSDNVTLTFSHAGNYFTNAISADCSVEISEDYNGNPETATWIKLKVETWPTDWNYVSAKVSLAAYKGKTVHIAFHYKGTKESAGVWEIKPFKVFEGEELLIPEGVTPKTVAQVKQLAENTDKVWVEAYSIGTAATNRASGSFVATFSEPTSNSPAYNVLVGELTANTLEESLYIDLSNSAIKAQLKSTVSYQKRVVLYGTYKECKRTTSGVEYTILGFVPTYAVIYDAEGKGTTAGTKPSN